jgi:N-acetylneuraminic acid mutarotase
MKKLVGIVLATALLSACGGGGNSTVGAIGSSIPHGPGAGTPSAKMAAVTFTIVVPARAASTAANRRMLYVSPSTVSVVVTLSTQNGTPVTPAQPYAVTVSGITGCHRNVGSVARSAQADRKPLAPVQGCRFSIPAPVGVDTFSVSTYDAPQTSPTPATLTGNLLSTGSVATTVVENAANTVTLTLGGVIASLMLSLNIPNPFEGAPQTISLIIHARDASGNFIFGAGNFAAPITLTNNDLSGATTLSTTTVNSSAANVTITYTGAPASATFTASAPGVPPATATLLSQGPGAWATLAPMPTARYELGAGAVNGILYTVGGDVGHPVSTVEAYDPVANAWTTKAPMPTARKSLRVGVVNGTVYAIGGYNVATQNTVGLATVEAYDPVANTWSTKAPMSTARWDLAVAVANGKIYAIGGQQVDTSGFDPTPLYLTTVEAYDPVANTWTTEASMPTARCCLTASTVNGKIYAIDGNNASSSALAIVEVYDPVANTWTTATPDLTAHNSGAAGVLGGGVYVLGGGYYHALSAVEAYDPVLDSWTAKAPMSSPLEMSGSDVINGILYVAGGLQLGNSQNLLESYTP